MAGNYPYRIESRDLDAMGRARICSLAELVLEAAGDDADSLGFGVDSINVNHASWVLSRVALELDRLPVHGETIDIYTWVSDFERMFSTRNTRMGDCGWAVTQWAMIDLATRRPLDIRSLAQRPGVLVDRVPPIERPRKVAAIHENEEMRNVHHYDVKYSDVDFNGHVNSIKYLEWMVDTLPIEELNGSGRVRVDLNYLHEALLGEELDILRERADDAWRFDIRNAGGTSVCRASIVL